MTIFMRACFASRALRLRQQERLELHGAVGVSVLGEHLR